MPIGLCLQRPPTRLPGPLDPGGASARNGGRLRVCAQRCITTVPTGGIPWFPVKLDEHAADAAQAPILGRGIILPLPGMGLYNKHGGLLVAVQTWAQHLCVIVEITTQLTKSSHARPKARVCCCRDIARSNLPENHGIPPVGTVVTEPRGRTLSPPPFRADAPPGSKGPGSCLLASGGFSPVGPPNQQENPAK